MVKLYNISNTKSSFELKIKTFNGESFAVDVVALYTKADEKSASEDEDFVTPHNGEAILRPESDELYGLGTKDGFLFIIANGTWYEAIVPHRDSYGHNFGGYFAAIENSGMEIETDNLYSTVVVATLLYATATNKEEGLLCYYDGSLNSGGAEFKVTLGTWAQLLKNGLIKSSLKFQSTHVHVSAPAVVYGLIANREQWSEWIERLSNTDCRKLFGREFHSRYAYQEITTYTYDRYAAITLPVAVYNNATKEVFIDTFDESFERFGRQCVSSRYNYILDGVEAEYDISYAYPKIGKRFQSNLRVTAEFRIARILDYEQLQRFVNVLAEISEVTVEPSEENSLENLFKAINKKSRKLINSKKFGIVSFIEKQYEEEDFDEASEYEETEEEQEEQEDNTTRLWNEFRDFISNIPETNVEQINVEEFNAPDIDLVATEVDDNGVLTGFVLYVWSTPTSQGFHTVIDRSTVEVINISDHRYLRLTINTHAYVYDINLHRTRINVPWIAHQILTEAPRYEFEDIVNCIEAPQFIPVYVGRNSDGSPDAIEGFLDGRWTRIDWSNVFVVIYNGYKLLGLRLNNQNYIYDVNFNNLTPQRVANMI